MATTPDAKTTSDDQPANHVLNDIVAEQTDLDDWPVWSAIVECTVDSVPTP